MSKRPKRDIPRRLAGPSAATTTTVIRVATALASSRWLTAASTLVVMTILVGLLLLVRSKDPARQRAALLFLEVLSRAGFGTTEIFPRSSHFPISS
jgi:hypothetical protein